MRNYSQIDFRGICGLIRIGRTRKRSARTNFRFTIDRTAHGEMPRVGFWSILRTVANFKNSFFETRVRSEDIFVTYLRITIYE
jgi:hypothetical protein